MRVFWMLAFGLTVLGLNACEEKEVKSSQALTTVPQPEPKVGQILQSDAKGEPRWVDQKEWSPKVHIDRGRTVTDLGDEETACTTIFITEDGSTYVYDGQDLHDCTGVSDKVTKRKGRLYGTFGGQPDSVQMTGFATIRDWMRPVYTQGVPVK